MIDIRSEKLIPLRDVPSLPWIPPRRKGSRLAVETVHRWATNGIRGVKLETVCAGDTRCTTEAGLLRFFERLNQPRATTATQTPSQRRKALAHAKAGCEALGF